MTFILSEINPSGVIMASDSSQRQKNDFGEIRYEYAKKTFYFKGLNIGISSWGRADIGEAHIDIGEWLKIIVDKFIEEKRTQGNGNLVKFTEYLAKELDIAFELQEKECNLPLHMGLHIGGFDSNIDSSPGFCHVYINHGQNRFVSELTNPKLKGIVPDHLRNGIHTEFCQMWPELYYIDEKYTNLFISKYCNGRVSLQDPIAIRAEWIGSWVRQISMVMKRAGLPEQIGKDIYILTLAHNGNTRCFRMKQMKEISPDEFCSTSICAE